MLTIRGPSVGSPAELRERLMIERAGRPFLVLRDDDLAQRLVPLPEDRSRLTVGRAPGCDLVIAWDSQSSRVHAELVRIGPGWMVSDGGLSRNGTYVNGRRVRDRRRLADRDQLRFGQTVVLYRQPEAPNGRVAQTVPGTELPGPAEVSPAQRAVLMALCRPFAGGDRFAAPATNGQIADELHLSVDAVKGHLRLLFAKFDLDTSAQNEKRLRLAERAMHTGAVAPERSTW